MLGTQKELLPGGSVLSKGAFSVGKALWGTANKRSVKTGAVALLVDMQSPEVLLTCTQAGKICGWEGEGGYSVKRSQVQTIPMY